MWFDLYLVSAVVAAAAVWLVAPHVNSYDPPGDIARGFWSLIAGALWPVIAIGAAQIFAIRYVARRLRSARAQPVEVAPLVALPSPTLHS